MILACLNTVAADWFGDLQPRVTGVVIYLASAREMFISGSFADTGENQQHHLTRHEFLHSADEKKA